MKKFLKIFGFVLATLILAHLSIAIGGRIFLSEQDLCEARIKKHIGLSVFEKSWYEDNYLVTEACRGSKVKVE